MIPQVPSDDALPLSPVRHRRAAGWLWVLFLSLCGIAQAAPDFARDVRPILERSCLGCHGPEKQKSGYRLDQREVAFKGGESGKPAIVPHSANHSPLIRYVSGADPDHLMPPEKSDAPRLSPEEVATLRAWIDAGPSWPDEWAGTSRETNPPWSLQPLRKPVVPGLSSHPIDGFIRASLAARSLTPSPEADRRTLIRRVTYDLTGLPPTPEEVEAFVASSAPNAYELLVNRLLASPRYGEHWARHWLDVAHYADTHGNDHDHARPNAWPYRDYVIRAFNEDRPYARFVQEQIAGDALFPEDPQATVALGFLAAGPWDDTLMVGVREDTFDHRLAQVLDRDDLVTTVMSTFQSFTVHCARCHNHKFDPVSQREYYALQAVFAGVDRADRPFDSERTIHIKRRALLARKSALERQDASFRAILTAPETAQKVAALTESAARRAAQWEPLDIVSVTSASGADTTFTPQTDGSWRVGGALPAQDTFIVTAQTRRTDLRALRLEALPDDSLPGRGPGRYHPTGNFHLTEFRGEAQPTGHETNGATRLEFTRATADHSDRGDVVARAIDGQPGTFWSIHPQYGMPHEAVFELKHPVGYESGTTLILRLEQGGTAAHQLGRFRLTFCTSALPEDQRAPLPARMSELLGKPESARTPEEQQELTVQILLREIERELAALPPPELVYAITRDFPPNGSFKPAAKPRPIHLLTRGDLNKPAELVGPGTLACVPGLSGDLAIADESEESNRRAALARWLTDERNALTWRSVVNRVWHYHFGRGLCDTPNDFGTMGGSPSHPELLDWLAVWFRDDAAGSLKALHRLIVTSATYRQSSGHRSDAAEVDADNRLLWRMNRVRLTAEQIRDSLLQLSGQLDLTQGGPAVVQFVHRDKATFAPEGGAPAFLDYENFAPDAPENRRRAIYRFVFRTVPDPLMDALDAPDGGTLTPVRSVSTTAVQAFALLNNPFVIRQCEHLAANLSGLDLTPSEQITAAFRRMLQRPPRPEELARFTTYAQQHGLANTCQVILNSNEFLHLD